MRQWLLGSKPRRDDWKLFYFRCAGMKAAAAFLNSIHGRLARLTASLMTTHPSLDHDGAILMNVQLKMRHVCPVGFLQKSDAALFSQVIGNTVANSNSFCCQAM
jgi:hypothetical protein